MLYYTILCYEKYAFIKLSLFLFDCCITCMHSTIGNGLFFTAPPHAGGFTLCMIEEIPTFLLALGSIFPSCRTDIGFGITFFIFRVLYHGYVLCFQIYFGVHMFAVTITFFSMLLHVFWFYGWASKYGKKLLSGGKNKKLDTKKQQ